MNIDFSAAPGFSAYVLLLMFSGVVMIVMASPTVKHSTMGVRALNALFGVGFLGYGFYLAFLFDGGGYLIFFKAFIVPVLMIVRTIRDIRAARDQEMAARSVTPPVGPTAPAVPHQRESAQPAGQWEAPDVQDEQPAKP